jgi:hypothetical protein
MGDVFAALTQSGNVYGENVETVIEIAAEGALGDKFGEVGIGGGNDPDVDAAGMVAAEALELLFLKNTKKLGLQVERKIGDFIEKKSAVVGKFESADLLGESASEGAALVPEELGFEESAGDGGAIDFDEGSLAARTVIVNSARDELFSGARFTGDKDSGASRSDEFDLRQSALESGTFADDFLEIEFTANFFLEIKLFLGKLVLQGVNLFEGQGVFDSDGDLSGDLLEQLDILRRESVLAAAGEIERSKSAAMSDERNTANRLNAFRAEHANDLVGETVNFGAAGEKWLAGGEAVAGRSGVEGNGDFLIEEAGTTGEIEGVDFQKAGGGVAKSETGVVMMNDFFERGDDAAKKVGKLAGGDEHVVHFEKNLEAIALAGKLDLIGLGGLVIERVINGDGNLTADALHKLKLGIGDALWDEASETHGAEAALRGGERNHGQRANADIAETLEKIGETMIFFGVADDKRLLRLPDPAGRMTIDRSFAACLGGGRQTSLEDVEAHDVANGVVKDEGEKVKIDDAVETLGKVVKKSVEVAMLGDGFRHFEQGFELTPGLFKRRRGSRFGWGDCRIRHTSQNSIGVGGGSTKGPGGGWARQGDKHFVQ